MAMPRFRTLAHGADLRLAVWGATEEELIRNAVLGTAGLALGRLPRPRPEAWVRVRPWPVSLPARLVRAVNEAIFQLYVRGKATVDLELRVGGARLGIVTLPPASGPAVEIKAATYHDLRPRRQGRRLAALLTLDV